MTTATHSVARKTRATVLPTLPNPHRGPRTYVPKASLHKVTAAAVCDGSGLIKVPTEDGPEYFACHGCDACQRLNGAAPVVSEQIAAQRLRDVFAAGLAADEEW